MINLRYLVQVILEKFVTLHRIELVIDETLAEKTES